MVSSVLPSTPLLAFTGRTLLTTTASSATSHQHLPWVFSRIDASGLSPETVSGFPSYCAGSLLEIPPSSTKQDWPSIGLRAILHAYPPVLPNQVHFRCVPLTSYGFLQTLLLANNALAIRIIFPSVRVIQVSFNLTGLPASLGKQKSSSGELLFYLTTFAKSATVNYLPLLSLPAKRKPFYHDPLRWVR